MIGAFSRVPPVHVVARGLLRGADLDGREQEGDRRGGADVLAVELAVDVANLLGVPVDRLAPLALYEAHGRAVAERGGEDADRLGVSGLDVVVQALPVDPCSSERSSAGSSRPPARTPGTPRSSPASRIIRSGARGPTIRRSTVERLTPAQRSSSASTCPLTGRWENEASAAAFIAPTLVPQKIETRSPRAASWAHCRTASAPAS